MRSLIVWTLLLFSTTALATETRLVVRARARDGKFIGTTMGGVRVVLKDAQSGQVLASGVTAGSTGNTQTLMKQPQARGAPLADEASAKFTATVDITEPLLVTVEASGPLAQRQALVTSTTQVWLLPGKHIEGDGLILELPGFVVDVQTPSAHEFLKLGADKKLTVPVRTNVTLMCGCPTEPKGLWDSSRYELEATVKFNGKPLTQFPMKFAGKTSTYEGTLTVQQPGAYEVTVTAYDPATGNVGVDATTFIVES
ncbi:hypothetical protein DRW03_04210 [Corallococcus sp. H22C18031201]|uniref:hypothetical protein n=1 Tax=Citreicoccus inhibens TaxID=2849499 RepID=UPI000E74D10C|nr:hypothetical protein [Citreicoccus inhibens]MBU8897798.1 hypothetical protein [Citreicoccus inhibens]RJS25693.1 hypothetical protein DRW03_04210 [Corallococcus sp. H22C18031201]